MVFYSEQFSKGNDPSHEDRAFIWKIQEASGHITVYYYKSTTNRNFDNYIQVYDHTDPAAKELATDIQVHLLIRILFKAKKIWVE